MQERQLDRVTNGLHGLTLTADARPGNGFHAGKSAIEALGSADNFDRDALVRIEPQIEPWLKLLFGEQGGAADDRIRNSSLIANTEAAVGKDFADANHR